MNRPALLNRSVGEYRLIDFLGAGGMGEVYRAVSTRTGRVAAVKILLETSRDSSERFRNEARLHGQMRHPNIVALYDFLDFEGRPCIAMEYVDGETLSDRISRGPLLVADAIPIFQSIAAAVRHIHEAGIVHRDLKPTNVRISAAGVVKLLDFGIAKSDWAPGLTRTGGVIGTPLYLSPEQLGSGKATARSDIWALGIVFYEMLSGKVPFEADGLTDLWEKIKLGSYPRLASLPAGCVADAVPLRASADRVIARCLRREPAERYASVQELLDEVGAIGAPRAAANWTTGLLTGGAMGAIARRWRLVAAAAAVVLLGLVLWAWRGGAESDGVDQPSAAVGAGTLHRIDVAEGTADVWVNDVRVGSTPYDYPARTGAPPIRLELRQAGFAHRTETFDVTTRKVWTFVMERDK